MISIKPSDGGCLLRNHAGGGFETSVSGISKQRYLLCRKEKPKSVRNCFIKAGMELMEDRCKCVVCGQIITVFPKRRNEIR